MLQLQMLNLVAVICLVVVFNNAAGAVVNIAAVTESNDATVTVISIAKVQVVNVASVAVANDVAFALMYFAAVAVINVAAGAIVNNASVVLMTDQLSTRVGFINIDSFHSSRYFIVH